MLSFINGVFCQGVCLYDIIKFLPCVIKLFHRDIILDSLLFILVFETTTTYISCSCVRYKSAFIYSIVVNQNV